MNTIETKSDVYHMITASIVDDEVVFNSDDDFNQAMKVGFFRIKAPADLDLEVGRAFAKTFTKDSRYNTFGELNVANGYLQSKVAQTVRFTLERDFWNKCHVNQKEVEGQPNYSDEIQKLGKKMHEIGIKVLRSILKKYQMPEDLWFKATAGSTHDEGSYFLLFNCYDPILGSRSEGVGAHKDWGYITVLDATDPGLEAKIDGVWRSLQMEDGYLTINFGEPLEKLLTQVHASEHRVVTQKEKMRISTVAFIDPRVGSYRSSAKTEDKEGCVYDWNGHELVNGETTLSYFQKLSSKLYGADQSGKSATTNEGK